MTGTNAGRGGGRTSADDRAVRRRSLVAGILLGIGTVSFVDETVFHQLLGWHHFYDRSTTTAGLVSDGIFHAFGWFATVAGLFLLVDLARRAVVPYPTWWGGLLLGAGGFQLYDGTVQHKLFGLHQIRYGVDLTAYDLVWNGAAVALIAAGILLIVRSGSLPRTPPPTRTPPSAGA
jgi:uncharacterized membrane protein